MATKIIQLSRPNKSVTWGFSIQGGKEFGCPLSVLRVTKNSVAEEHGLNVQDLIININDKSTSDLTHQQAILLIQNLNVKLETKKPNDSNEIIDKRVSINELPPPPEDIISLENKLSHSRISTNLSDLPLPPLPSGLPPPPPKNLNSKPINNNNLSNIPPPPPPPPPSTSIAQTTTVPQNTTPTMNSKTESCVLPSTIKASTPAQSTFPSSTNNSNSANSRFTSRASLPVNSLNNIQLNKDNVENFRKLSQTNATKTPIGLAPFLQQVTNQNSSPGRNSTGNVPSPRDTLKNMNVDIQGPNKKWSSPAQNQSSPRTQEADGSICWVCKDHIRGPYIEANNKIYCVNHFCCIFCQQPIKGSQFIETKEGSLYCMDDYKQNIAPKCDNCRQPIVQQQVMALGKIWHPQCFVCDHCKSPIPGGNFHVKEDENDGGKMKVYCETDYKAYYEIKCYGCKFPIEGDDKYVKYSGNNYHVTCYKR